MSAGAGPPSDPVRRDNAYLHELELAVRAELAEAEAGEPQAETAGLPIDEWLVDPADAQRTEVGLRSLLGAVEAMEEAPGPATVLRPQDRQVP